MLCAFLTIVSSSLFLGKPDENLKNFKSIMSFQRAFVFLNYREYTAGLHVAQFSNKLWGIKSLPAVFFLLHENRHSCPLRFDPGAGSGDFLKATPVWNARASPSGCLLPCKERLIHSSTHEWAVSSSFFFLCPANACSATIISAQVGWLLFQALSRWYCPQGYPL